MPPDLRICAIAVRKAATVETMAGAVGMMGGLGLWSWALYPGSGASIQLILVSCCVRRCNGWPLFCRWLSWVAALLRSDAAHRRGHDEKKEVACLRWRQSVEAGGGEIWYEGDYMVSRVGLYRVRSVF